MGDLQQAPLPPDPEAICTRVVARVIEELSCIEIAPDSPEWTDLRQDDARVGQLAVYRGRNGVERMVSASVRLTTPSLNFHKVAVFTDPQSMVPHLLVDALVSNATPGRAHFRVDLLPRVPLEGACEYVRCCYAPLDDTLRAASTDTRFVPSPAHAVLDVTARTPWHLAYSLISDDLEAADACVQRYVDHWSLLMRLGIPLAVQRESQEVDLVAHNHALRRRTFDRSVDPVWAELDAALAGGSVDLLLRALHGA